MLHEFSHAFGMVHPPMNDSCGYPSILQPHNSVLELISSAITAHDKYGLVKQYEDRANRTTNAVETHNAVEERNFYNIPGDDIIADSEEIIDDLTTYIVKGRVLGSQNVVLSYDNYTLTDFEVTTVYKGNGISPGDIVQIKEPYHTETYTDGWVTTYRRNNYTESIVGEEYIFYLNQDKGGTYWPSCTSLSRYPLSDEISVVFPDSDNPNYTEENYAALREEVLSKYQ